MTEKKLGKIKSARFGIGGYQDAMLGVYFDLGGDGWGVMDSKCTWDSNTITPDENHQWTEEDRVKLYSETMYYVSDLLNQAKVKDFNKLAGIPIEVEFDGNRLKSWRILTEVL